MNDLRISNLVSLQMIYCPEGEAYLGTDDPRIERIDTWPRIRVRLTRPFWFASTLITEKQFVAVGNTYHSVNPSQDVPALLSWHESESYLKQLNQRLTGVLVEIDEQQKLTIGKDLLFDFPTQAQWEYACRAGTETLWHFGDDIHLLNEYGWCHGPSPQYFSGNLPEVKQKKPNPWGFYDFYGLVSEWCKDDFVKLTSADEQTILVDPLFVREKDPTSKYTGYIKPTRGGAIDSPIKKCNSSYQTMSDSYNEYGFNIGLRPALVFA
jgi:formylglycine-generating enzyme required for sulfatase activity